MPQAMASSAFVMENLNTELSRWTLYSGGFVFVTTGATITVKVPDAFRHYHVLGITWTGTPAADEIPSVAAPDSNGVCTSEGSPGGYYITITRTGASKTSALAGTLTIRALPG